MAKKNLKKLTALSIAYNVPFQPLYTKEALEKNNLEVVHKCLIGGQEYNCLMQKTYTDYENIFKSVANGENTVKQDNSVTFNSKGFVYINGNKHAIFDVIKDMEMWQIYDILNQYLNHGEEWQRDLAIKIRDYIKAQGFIQWLEYQYEKEYGETVDEYMARVEDEEGMRV
jgi:predicted nucleotide-binding protein (sugar kinase/HSP70/actin superfamily)